MKSHSTTLKMKTAGVILRSDPECHNYSFISLLLLLLIIISAGSLLISDRIIPSYNGPSVSRTITHWSFENLHGEERAFYERVGSFPLRNCNYFMACTQNQCVFCGFATDSHNCRALIIYRQVKPAVAARNRKSLNKKHPVTMIFLNEHDVSSSRVFFFWFIFHYFYSFVWTFW